MAIKVDRGRPTVGWRAVFYGPIGAGKTTLALGAPDPVVLSGEGGDLNFDVARLYWEDKIGARTVKRYSPASWLEVRSKLDEVRREGLPGKTLVLDGFGAMEKRCGAWILETKTDDKGRPLPSLNAMFGMGDQMLLDELRATWNTLEAIWMEQGVNILITCHDGMRKATDERGEFTTRSLGLNGASRGDVAGWLAGWADIVGLVELETKPKVLATKLNGDAIMTRESTGRRVLRVRPSDESEMRFVAKCRYNGPDSTIPLPKPPASAWAAFWSQVEAGPLDEAKLRAELKAALPARLAAIKAIDPEQAKKTEAWAAGNPTARAIWTWLRRSEANGGNGAQPAAA